MESQYLILSVGALTVMQQFLEEIEAQNVRTWIGGDPLCVVPLLPDGPYYGKPLADSLDAQGYSEMDVERKTLTDQEQLRGKKVLLVDNDIVTGRTFKRAMRFIRSLKDQLAIKGVKYAVYTDRLNLADYVVESVRRAREPIKKTCVLCSNTFEVTPSGIGLYDDLLARRRCCPSCSRRVAPKISKIMRVFAESGKLELSLQEIADAINVLQGPEVSASWDRYTPARVEKYLRDLDLAVEVEDDLDPQAPVKFRFNPAPED